MKPQTVSKTGWLVWETSDGKNADRNNVRDLVKYLFEGVAFYRSKRAAIADSWLPHITAAKKVRVTVTVEEA